MLGETENQFLFTRVACSRAARRKSKSLSVHCLVLLTFWSTLFLGAALAAADLRVQDIRLSHDGVQLVWQSSPGSNYTIESAEYLASYDTFGPLVENIPATGILTSNTFSIGPDLCRYFRVLEQGGATNRLGKIVLISDFHLSPFLDRATTEALVTHDITSWDGLFSTTTNGFFTPDATGEDISRLTAAALREERLKKRPGFLNKVFKPEEQ